MKLLPLIFSVYFLAFSAFANNSGLSIDISMMNPRFNNDGTVTLISPQKAEIQISQQQFFASIQDIDKPKYEYILNPTAENFDRLDIELKVYFVSSGLDLYLDPEDKSVSINEIANETAYHQFSNRLPGKYLKDIYASAIIEWSGSANVDSQLLLSLYKKVLDYAEIDFSAANAQQSLVCGLAREMNWSQRDINQAIANGEEIEETSDDRIRSRSIHNERVNRFKRLKMFINEMGGTKSPVLTHACEDSEQSLIQQLQRLEHIIQVDARFYSSQTQTAAKNNPAKKTDPVHCSEGQIRAIVAPIINQALIIEPNVRHFFSENLGSCRIEGVIRKDNKSSLYFRTRRQVHELAAGEVSFKNERDLAAYILRALGLKPAQPKAGH